MTNKQLTVIGLIITGASVFIPLVARESNTHFENNGSALAIDSEVGEMNVINNYEHAPDPNFENFRTPELSELKGKELIQTWFDLMNEGKWKDGCSLMSKDKCNTSNGEDILEHSREPRLKTVRGYENIEIWHSANAPEDLWCVKYAHQERQSTIQRNIFLVMQYKLSPRSDGGEDIASRLCEKNWIEGLGDRPCSVPSAIKFCL